MANRLNSTIDLDFEPVEITALWSIQGNREYSLAEFETALFGTSLEVSATLHNESLQLIRPWPHQAYLLTSGQPLPQSIRKHHALMTDISDACCRFRLSGEQAFAFMANYLSADLHKINPDSACLRCRLGHYVVLLWWDDRSQLHLLQERSVAQSFVDYLETLMARWRPQTPR